jgi:spoIIIJ-associated protein
MTTESDLGTENALLEVEASGETVGEAKWLALRELEKRQPGLDRDAVAFEVLSEGERGLLGVGRSPARVIARAAAAAGPAREDHDESDLCGVVRELLERVTSELGVHCRVRVVEDEETVTGLLEGGDLGLVIGKHGQTIDALQYLASAIVHRRFEENAKSVVVDAAGYRERRRERLSALALRAAEQVAATGHAVELEPMSAVERKLVHVCLQDVPGVETRSEGEEPSRRVVVEPAGD